MPYIVVNDITPRIQYTATAGQTVFTFPFLMFFATDINVYKRLPSATPDDLTDILTYNIDYTVSINVPPAVGGSITLLTPAALGDIVTLVRNQPDQRLNYYIQGGPFTSSMVNFDFDQIVLMDQQRQMYDEIVGIHYNLNAVIDPNVDNYLPVLGSNQLWRKNSNNDAIETVTLPNFPIGSVGGAFTQSNRLVITDVSGGQNDIDQTDLQLSSNTLSRVSGSWGLSSGTDLTLQATGALNLQQATWPTTQPATGQTPVATSPGVLDWGFSPVVTPLPVVDDAVMRANGTSGNIQDSLFIITDAGVGSGLTQLNVDNLRLDGNTLSSTDSNGNINLLPNGSGQLLAKADPVAPLGVATKQYVDAVGGGLEFKDSVVAASTIALTVTYANGAAGIGATLTNAGAQAAFALDGVTPVVNERVLIKNQASAFQNGIYIVTDTGSVATNWVLTRATDYDAPDEMQPGSFVIVDNGTVNINTSWVQSSTVTTVGVDAVNFSQFTYGTTFPNLTVTGLTASKVVVTDSNKALASSSVNSADLPYAILQNGTALYGVDSVGTDSYAVTLAPVPAGYVNGMVVNFNAGTANTGAATLNVNGLGAKTIKKLHDQDLTTGDIESGQIVTVVYDGTNFQMQSQLAQDAAPSNVVLQNGTPIFGADAGATDSYSITLAPAPSSYVTGMVLNFSANTANTGASTLNVNGLGAVPIKKQHDQDTATGNIEAGQIVTVIYDGTNFQMQSQTATSAVSGFTSVNIQSFTSSGTYTPTTGMQYCIIFCVGGGGGGGGTAASSSGTSAAGGGGGGALSIKYASAATIGASKTLTIGAGGTAATAGVNSGGTGGDTSISTICVAKGGQGGSGASANSFATGGAGGALASGTGDVKISGNKGGVGMWSTSSQVYGTITGQGGSAPFIGGYISAIFSSAGSAGENYGAGGQGGSDASNTSKAGGVGFGGLVFVIEFI